MPAVPAHVARHAQLVKQLRQYMTSKRLSKETVADRIGYATAAELTKWLKLGEKTGVSGADARSGDAKQSRAIDDKVQSFLDDEMSENEEEEEEEEEEEDFVTCDGQDGACGRRLLGEDIVFTDGALEYCEDCHLELGLQLRQTTAAACLEEEDEDEDDGEGEGEGEGSGGEGWDGPKDSDPGHDKAAPSPASLVTPFGGEGAAEAVGGLGVAGGDGFDEIDEIDGPPVDFANEARPYSLDDHGIVIEEID